MLGNSLYLFVAFRFVRHLQDDLKAFLVVVDDENVGEFVAVEIAERSDRAFEARKVTRFDLVRTAHRPMKVDEQEKRTDQQK